jgi:iron(III) transport system substrate-binding protein
MSLVLKINFKWLVFVAILMVSALTVHLWPTYPLYGATGNLVIYSGRKEKAIKPVVAAFTKATNIQADLKVGKTSGLANEIRMEKANPRGDLFISTEGGIMEILANDGVLESYQSSATQQVPPEFKNANGLWTGISGRARIILYNKTLVPEKDLPESVFDLVNPKWKGKLAIAGTRERTTLAWVSAIMATKGEAFTRDYIKGLQNNGLKILSDNTEVWQGVGRGEFAIGLTNSPNYYLAKKSGLPVGVIYPDQGASGWGTPISPNAVAIIKGAANVQAAKKFIDFVLSPAGQRILVDSDYEIPLVAGVDSGEVVAAKSIKQPTVSEQRLAELADPTLTLLSSLSPDW